MSERDDELLRVVRALPPAPEEEDARATIHRALDYCQALARHPGMNKDTKALLGITGVGALSLLALRGSIEFSDEIKARQQPRGADLDETEALARVIASEVGSHSLKEQVAVAWAVRNRARGHHPRAISIAQLVCSPRCGPQRGRPFSSARPATDETRQVAAVVLESTQDQDPTHGALAFFEPVLMDKLFLDGAVNYNSDQLRAKWRADRLRKVGSVGRVELWGRA